MAQIYPSLIAGDVLNLGPMARMLEPHCTGFHLDVMDFQFVQNLTCGPLFVNALRKAVTKPLWVHLMVEHPEKYLKQLQLKSKDLISVHLESAHDPNIFTTIRSQGLLASIAINPDTEITQLAPYLDRVDHVLLMTVRPGFSGQKFLVGSVERLAELKKIMEYLKHKPLIGVDGGLNRETLPQLLDMGIDMAGMGSGIFEQDNPATELEYWLKV
ncbi:MAG: ribulose-phosphate 3-epimerase [Candidatus Dependentiae bacterium]|nr:ribulose-phosphate 3-epimerase [Candidatus Dependentiae bacterium]